MKTSFKLLLIFNVTLILSWLSGVEAQAQNVGINGSGATAHTSALLDLDDAAGGNNKGLLIPRIPLTAINAAAPVTSPATSLLVYNTASASTGTNAVSPGYYYWDGTKWVRFQIAPSGISSFDWSLIGNAGTVSGTNFIGTTDNQNLIFKRNSINSGLLSPLNTSFGYNSGGFVSLSAGNSAFGAEALTTVSGFGNSNAAFGYKALTLTSSGQDNSAFGSNSAQNNTTGRANSSFGMASLTGNTTGAENVALGWAAGNSVSTGLGNTLVGARTDVAAGTFTNATAIGYNAKVGQSNALILGGTGTDAVNVGIGTTVPSNALHVRGGNNPLKIERNGVDSWEFAIDANRLHFLSTSTSSLVMSINRNGFVGINNFSPSEALDVIGSVKIVDGTQGAGKVLTSDVNGKASWKNAVNTALVWNGSRIITIPNTGYYMVTMYADDSAQPSAFTNSYTDAAIVSGAFNGIALEDVSSGQYYLANANSTIAYGVSCSGSVYLTAGTQIRLGSQSWMSATPAIWCLTVIPQ